MRISRMPIEILGRFLSAIALACTFSLFVLYTTDSAEARVVLSQCQRKHSYCTERCIMNNKTFDVQNACIKRTCDKQNPGCGAASIGKSGGGKLIQTNPGGSTGGTSAGGVLTSPLGGAGSWTNTSGVFPPNSSGAASKKKPHSQPEPTPTAEPKPAPGTEPTPSPTAEPKSTPPIRPTANVRDHRVTTPKIDGDRSSPGVTETRYGYEGAVKASRPGPSESRKPKIRDHRAQPEVRDHTGVDSATRSGPSEARKPKIRDHRAGAQSAGTTSNVPPKTAGSSGQVCGISGTPPCRRQ